MKKKRFGIFSFTLWLFVLCKHQKNCKLNLILKIFPKRTKMPYLQCWISKQPGSILPKCFKYSGKSARVFEKKNKYYKKFRAS